LAKSYLTQEEDGTSRFTLEEGGGFLLLAEFGIAVIVGTDEPGATVMGGAVAGAVASAAGGTVGGDKAGAEVAPS
jgi:hypothetical protein